MNWLKRLFTTTKHERIDELGYMTKFNLRIYVGDSEFQRFIQFLQLLRFQYDSEKFDDTHTVIIKDLNIEDAYLVKHIYRCILYTS